MSDMSNFQYWIQSLNNRDRHAVSPYVPEIIEIIYMSGSSSSPELILAEKIDKLRKIQHRLPDRIGKQLDRLFLESVPEPKSSRAQPKLLATRQINARSNGNLRSEIKHGYAQKYAPLEIGA